MNRSRQVVGIVAAVAFVATVWLANWAIAKWGPVPVGFGLEAPAGVYFAGLAFTLRDVVHRTLGRWVVVVCILVGSALAYFVEANIELGGPVSLPVASAIAFLLSELADLAVYEPIRARGWLPAVVLSNIVGIVIDSAIFLWLAFGSLGFFWGQVVGKAWMTVLAIIVLSVWAALRVTRDPELA
jgi:queuosine precursor transporter